jgi:hypothetical protein
MTELVETKEIFAMSFLIELNSAAEEHPSDNYEDQSHFLKTVITLFNESLLSIIDLINAGRTCKLLYHEIRKHCLLKIQKNTGETFTHSIILSTIATCLELNVVFVRDIIKKYLLNEVFLTGSVLTSAVLGVLPFSGADVDLYIKCPTNSRDFDLLIERLQGLTNDMLLPAGYSFTAQTDPWSEIPETPTFDDCLHYLYLCMNDHMDTIGSQKRARHEYGFSSMILDIFSYTRQSNDGYVLNFFGNILCFLLPFNG